MLGDNIKEIRILKKLGLNELAKKSNISGSYLSNIEKGIKNNPSIEALSNIADALDVSIEEFFTIDECDIEIVEEKRDKDNGCKKVKSYARTRVLNRTKKKVSTLDSIPEKFTKPFDARQYIIMHKMFASPDFDVNKMSDKDVLNFGNDLLEQMKMVGYKYKK